MLTKKQRDLLILLHESLQKEGVVPSFEEMKNAMGLKSKSGIHRLISSLEERGFILRKPNRARAIDVLKLPENYNGKTVSSLPRAKETVGHLMASKAAMVDIPLCGKIAAGSPIEAISHQDGQAVVVPAALIGRGDHYALTIEGDSMIEAGINDNDIVIIQETDKARTGDIVVALIDEQEATLKELRHNGKMIDLIPRNRALSVQSYPAERVRIQGKLAGLFRMYG